ncbi:hypothetical protein CMV_002367 [Castanea mollissima]|uniref:Protein kinase domain-containing protein n=1 Tax=Castanea mollissima TaxID=60419 RepID=A0A8J4VXL0_9ROSI|nr:hypothetical protein CMV_002367 [Castanea mollissima]
MTDSKNPSLKPICSLFSSLELFLRVRGRCSWQGLRLERLGYWGGGHWRGWEFFFSNGSNQNPFQGDLRAFLKKKGALTPTTAVRFALDIARGMNYLHENKPPIIHRDLEPSNILRDDSGHLKIGLLLVKKLLRFTEMKNEEYDTKVDVFSFALILQEMIEGCPPFSAKQENEVPKVYAAEERPPFNSPAKHYAHGLKEIAERLHSRLWCANDGANENWTVIKVFTWLGTVLGRSYRETRQPLHPNTHRRRSRASSRPTPHRLSPKSTPNPSMVAPLSSSSLVASSFATADSSSLSLQVMGRSGFSRSGLARSIDVKPIDQAQKRLTAVRGYCGQQRRIEA